eukprot:SAG31_NODE_143_length_22627_cov_14.541347_6_plen_620_part_00
MSAIRNAVAIMEMPLTSSAHGFEGLDVHPSLTGADRRENLRRAAGRQDVSSGTTTEDDARGPNLDLDPLIPMPDFGLKTARTLITGVAGAAAANPVDSSSSPERETPRERALLALFVISPLLWMAQPLWFPEFGGASKADALLMVTMSFFFLITGVSTFRGLCKVTHPFATVELVTGATYTTTRGHLARLAAASNCVPRSTVLRLRSLQKRLLIAGVVLSLFFVGLNLTLTSMIWSGLAARTQSFHYDFQAILSLLSSLHFVIWIFVFSSWLLSLRVATALTSSAMFARAKQTSTLAKAAQKPPKEQTIFASMRFPVPEEAIQLQRALATEGITMHIVQARAGQDISDEVFEWIEHADTFLVFGTLNYAEDTGNPASSYAEAKYAQHQGKRIILLRMIPWNQEFQHLQARVMFGQNKLTLDWQLGAPMAPALCQHIVDALDLDRTSSNGHTDATASTVIANRSRAADLVSNNMIDDAEWRAKVEAPALQLANSLLPALSEGWGSTVGMVCFGLEMSAILIFVSLTEHGYLTRLPMDILDGDWLNAFITSVLALVFLVFPGVLPFYIAGVGEISTACRRLEGSIQAYCVKDLRMHRLVSDRLVMQYSHRAEALNDGNFMC